MPTPTPPPADTLPGQPARSASRHTVTSASKASHQVPIATHIRQRCHVSTYISAKSQCWFVDQQGQAASACTRNIASTPFTVWEQQTCAISRVHASFASSHSRPDSRENISFWLLIVCICLYYIILIQRERTDCSHHDDRLVQP